MTNFKVVSSNVNYDAAHITSTYKYETTSVTKDGDNITVTPVTTDYTFRTERKVPRVGMMLVGLGGNNGSTVAGGIIANRAKMTWNTKEGEHKSNFYGSVTQASTLRVGATAEGEDVYIPFSDMLPTVAPTDLVVGGWDINGANLADAMARSKVFAYDLQRQLAPELQKITPLPSIYYPDFIAANQEGRADNVVEGSKASMQHVAHLRKDIRDFKAQHNLDKVVVLWTANTERFCEVTAGVHDSADNIMAAIKSGHAEVSPSTVFAVASILEGCSYINGSPQNTLVPGVVELADANGVFVGGDDFKTGQTKIKSVLVDFLVSAGIKPRSIVSYNHLGNNDGCNLSSPKQFRSKEISKSNVVDDMVASNRILYEEGEHPDHCVVIKYVPYVADSKRAMDEYTSEIFMGGHNTISMHNTCEDSLLAAPLILDLVILTELFERITFKTGTEGDFTKMNSVLSVLSYLLKAPMVPNKAPVVNALFKQRACIENIFRACVGLSPESHMQLEHRQPFRVVKPAEGA